MSFTSYDPLRRGLGAMARSSDLDRWLLDLEISLSSDSHFFVGLTDDIASGVFVATYQTHAVGSAVDIELTLPDGTLRARGVVRWVREACDGAGPGLGIALEGLTRDDLACIQRFCARRTPLYYDLDLDEAS